MKLLLHVVLAALMGLGACSVVRAEGPKVLFKVTFDAGKTDADFAAGSGKAALENLTKDPGAKLEFEPSLSGFGSALVIGEKNLGLAYDLKGNADYDKGSLSFWFRRIGLRPKADTGSTLYRYDVLRWDGDNGVSGYVYKWEHYGNITLLRVYQNAGKYTMTLAGDADDGNWHFITFTWAGSRVRGYLDGRFSCEQEKFELPTFNRLVVGDFHDLTKGDACRRLVDDITIYGEALSSSEIKRLYREGHGLDAPATLTIPPRRNAIKIDGRISPQEWEGTAETTGFADLQTGLYAATQTHARLCYDDQALYIALSSEFPQRVKDDAAMTIGMTGALRQTCDKFDAGVDSDDSFEIHLEPQAITNRFCRLVVNGLNTHYDYDVTGDYRHGQIGTIRLDWNPKWESASFLDGEGWHAEMRIPFADFGVPAPKPGDTWGLSLLRRWLALQTEIDGWGFNGRAPNINYGHETARVKFGATDTPVVQLKNWGCVHQGFVNLEATVLNPSDQDLSLKVDIASDSKELRETKELAISPKGTAPITANAKLKDFTTSQVALAASRKDGEVIFRSGELLCIPEELKVNTAHYPSKGILRVEVDAGRLSDLPLGELALNIQMKDRDGKEVLPATRLTPLPSYQNVSELNVAKVPPGAYVVQCGITHKGKLVFDRKIDFEKKPPPEWYGNTLGITDRPPKPFTPVTREGNTLGCWGRSYVYRKGLFPAQITTRGQEILSRPIELVIENGSGKTHTSTADLAQAKAPKWGKHTGFRIDYETSGRLGGVPVTATSWLECDGLIWTRLAIGPTTGEVRKVMLRIPLRKEWARYVNTSDYATVKDGFVPASGMEGSENALWLGNGYGGLQWIIETYDGCKLAKGTAPARVKPGDSETVLEICLLDEPAALAQPFVQEFGLIATPVRPPTPEYRRWNTYTAHWFPEVSWNETSKMDWSDAKSFLYAGNPTVLKPGLGNLKPPKPVDGAPQFTILAPHVMVAQVCKDDPNYVYWGDEWSPTANGRKIADVYGITSTTSATWRDFFVWNYAQVYKRVRMPGVYYDCDMEADDDNHYHDGGIRVGGQVFVKPSMLGTRRLMQRLYTMLREREPEQTMIGLHSSGFLNLVYMAWCDWYGDGENFTSRLNKRNPDYHKLYRLDSFLAKSMGHNTGLTVRILDEQDRAHATDAEDWKRLGPQPTLHFYGMVLLHDSVFWHAYGNPVGYQMVNDALIKYDFGERYRVIGWYFDQKIVKLPENVYATFYKDEKTGRVLIALLNNNEQRLELKLALDWAALGIKDSAKAKVDDPVFNEGAAIRDGALVTPIGAVNMRLIAVEP